MGEGAGEERREEGEERRGRGEEGGGGEERREERRGERREERRPHGGVATDSNPEPYAPTLKTPADNCHNIREFWPLLAPSSYSAFCSSSSSSSSFFLEASLP